MHELLLDPRAHLAGLALAVALGAVLARRAFREAFPADPMAHGGWWCCKFCDRASPPPAPVRWLKGAWTMTRPGRP